MKNQELHHLSPPKLLLILGTDASGKDFIATRLSSWLNDSGHSHEKRVGRFSGKPSHAESSEDKGAFSIFAEDSFIRLYPLFGFMLPWLVTTLIHFDLYRYRHSDKHVIVVSHTALRLLAFHLGHHIKHEDEIKLSRTMHNTLSKIVDQLPLKTIVLDVDDEIRKQRIAGRNTRGFADPFDRYMAKDKNRSELIEAILVRLAKDYLGAHVIENNNLSEEKLRSKISAAFDAFNQQEKSNQPPPA